MESPTLLRSHNLVTLLVQADHRYAHWPSPTASTFRPDQSTLKGECKRSINVNVQVKVILERRRVKNLERRLGDLARRLTRGGLAGFLAFLGVLNRKVRLGVDADELLDFWRDSACLSCVPRISLRSSAE
eukprot:1193185-Amorphochlora_amoeboformis.AAC.1